MASDSLRKWVPGGAFENSTFAPARLRGKRTTRPGVRFDDQETAAAVILGRARSGFLQVCDPERNHQAGLVAA